MNGGKFEVEEFFDEFMADIGGDRIDTCLSGDPQFKNADYKVDFANYILELKTLEIDQVETKPFRDRLYREHKDQLEYLSSPEAKSKPAEVLAEETMERFEKDCIKALQPAISRRISKANKQIRETKNNLGLNEYAGAVWIVNENNTILNPSWLVEVVSRILQKDDFSEVEAVILSNLNLAVDGGEIARPSLFWVPVYRTNESEIMYQFTQYLGVQWAEFIKSKFNLSEVPMWQQGFNETQGRILEGMYNKNKHKNV